MVEGNTIEFYNINFPNRLYAMVIPTTCLDAMVYGTYKLKKEVLAIYRKNNNTNENIGEPIDP